jgi:hypothetical protein
MDLEQNQQKNLIDTTDCLEAISVFRGWKNFLFVIVILCLLLLQVSFWLVDTGFISTEQTDYDKASVSVVVDSDSAPAAITAKVKENIKKTAEQVVATTNNSTEAEPHQLHSKLAKLHIKVEFKHLAWFIDLVNFVLILAAILYCLTMLFSIKISLLGRLGGINHICRAFFLSLVFLVLLFPWQIPWRRFFAGELFGAMYTSGDLLNSFTALKDSGIVYRIFYYFRFNGYWLIALLVLIFSYIRSSRWAKATLRRLEVI